MNVAILLCISPSSSAVRAQRAAPAGRSGRFEAGNATLDAEGLLHALRGCRYISFRNTRLADDLIPRHFPVTIHLDDQVVAFTMDVPRLQSHQAPRAD